MKKMNFKRLLIFVSVVFVLCISYVFIPLIDFSNKSDVFETNPESYEVGSVIDYGSLNKVNFSYPTKFIGGNGVDISDVSFVAFKHQYKDTEFYNCEDDESYIGDYPIKFGMVDLVIKERTFTFCKHIIEKYVGHQEVQNNYIYAFPYDDQRTATLSFSAKYKPCDLDVCEDIKQEDIDNFVESVIDSLDSN